MNKFFIMLLLYIVTMSTYAQSYKDNISFKSDLWLIVAVEEAKRTPGDTIGVTWEQRTIKKKQNALYIDISKNGTLIGLKFPREITLSSEGLPNNGFIGEKWYGNYSMWIQSYAKDEKGNLWEVTVGKDSLSDDGPESETGRIYVTIQDTKGLQSGWYFVINTFGE